MKRIALTLLAALAASPAFAHVTLQTPDASPGTFYKGVLTVPHGCDGAATTKVTVHIPEGLINVKAMVKPGWTVTYAKGKYKQTYDYMHGMTLSEGVQEIAWSGGNLPDDFFDEFIFSGFVAKTVPAGALYFPVEQICEKGHENWNEIPTAGQSPHNLKSPAPMLRITADASASATMFMAGTVMVEDPFLGETPPGAQIAGGYMTITNTGRDPDRLLGGTLDGIGSVEIHEMSIADDVMRMRALPDGLTLQPGQTVTFKPDGYHLMIKNLKTRLTKGQTIHGTLRFEKAGPLDLTYTVRAMGEDAGDHSHGH